MHSKECRITNAPRKVKVLPLISPQNSVVGLAVIGLSQNTGWELEVGVLDSVLHDSGESLFLRLKGLLDV
jgi:hypothetical protein